MTPTTNSSLKTQRCLGYLRAHLKKQGRSKGNLKDFVGRISIHFLLSLFAVCVSSTRKTVHSLPLQDSVTASCVTFFKFFFQTIPDKKVGTASKISPPPTYNVDNRVIFSLFVGRNAIFSNIDQGGWGICATAQVYQLLLSGIVANRIGTQCVQVSTAMLTDLQIGTNYERIKRLP